MPESLTEILRRELNHLETQLGELSKRKEALESLLDSYAGGGKSPKVLHMPAPGKKTAPSSTLDMAEQVLDKHGEMKAEELMEAIREEFGVRPAHTLPQMLYIRARAKKRFYRTNDGKFGVIGAARRHSKKAA
jgi:HB1, ASXL, restriction endonuclease HTH domain